MITRINTSESRCPVCRNRCQSSSRLHGFLGRTLLRFIRMHSFWCGSCDLQFYAFTSEQILRQES